MAAPSIDDLRAAGILSPLDEHFARTVGRLAGEADPGVILAAALASRHVGNGHVCLDLRRLVGEQLVDDSGEIVSLEWPPVDDWLAALRASPLVAGERDGARRERPLILDARGRLYLQRYWDHQHRLAEAIKTRIGNGTPESLVGRAAPGPPRDGQLDSTRRLSVQPGGPGTARPTSVRGQRREKEQSQQMSLFGETIPDWQRIAALAAVERPFCVISGGPGTGKTYTVVKILTDLVEQAFAAGKPAPRIQLVAPTGKAAARLQDSIRANKATLAADVAVRDAIPEEASTIHRSLGSRRGSNTRFHHDLDNPLLADVVLVDEASMVDLALMARLVDALPSHARLILLGDKDQLASVEAGAVLGDICNTGGRREHSRAFASHVAEVTGQRIPLADDAPDDIGIWDCVVHLTHSYRYDANSGIGALAAAINAGDADRALELLDSPGGEIRLVETGGDSLHQALLPVAVEGFRTYLGQTEPESQLAALDGFRVLCAYRRGPYGVETINREIEAELERRGLIETGGHSGYVRRPLLVTRNDYQVDLFNGDVGIVGVDKEGERVAFFVRPGGERRSFALSRLPPHETVFAMTVHKSQGSEFGHVAVVLPPEMSPVLSRELLYTAVSRARRRVTLFASRDVLRQSIARRIERASGLRDLLWG